jgi:hypothetical protein
MKGFLLKSLIRGPWKGPLEGEPLWRSIGRGLMECVPWMRSPGLVPMEIIYGFHLRASPGGSAGGGRRTRSSKAGSLQGFPWRELHGGGFIEGLRWRGCFEVSPWNGPLEES